MTNDNAPSGANYPAAFSIGSAAAYIGVSHAKLRCMIYGGELPSVKIGGRRVVRKVTLDSFLAANESTLGGAAA